MYRQAISRFVLIALVALPIISADVAKAARTQDVLVVPARQRTVSLAFDVRALRDLVMITYRGTAATETPLMHVWSPTAKRWQELAPEAYAIGQFTDAQPGTLYLIGTDRDLPASVIEGTSQAAEVVRIDSMSMAEIANTLNQHLKFSPREWQALAERHGIKTEDLNYERRKWGRFGPPPSARVESPAPAVVPQDEDPPADPAAEQVAEPVEEPEADIPEAVEPDSEDATPPTEQPEEAKPEEVKPFVMDASVGASLEPETEIKTPAEKPAVIEEKGVSPKQKAAPMIEEKGAPAAGLPSIDELLEGPPAAGSVSADKLLEGPPTAGSVSADELLAEDK